MPRLIDIVQSVQIPQLIGDSFIKKGKPILDERNRPMHYAGGFAVVFPFVVNGKKWAFRCWSADLGNVERRLNTLSTELKRLNLPYFCDFTYEAEGIVVNGLKYPTTRMQWIDGQNIKDFIVANKHNSAILHKLANNFVSMCRTLHENKIAHGDLQHSNILVDKNENLFLIDYDSVFLPALKGESDIINGLPDYQHPRRIANVMASEKLDYFSELVIYTSILAIAERPEFVEEYNIEEHDRLLFCKEDYGNFTQSNIYAQLLVLGGEFCLLLDIFEKYLQCSDIDYIEPFDAILERLSRTPEIKYLQCDGGKVVYKGDTIRLLWQQDNVAKLSVNGNDVTGQRYYKVNTESIGHKHFELLAVNGLKQKEYSIDVEVVAEPQLSLKTSSKKLRKGKDETVTVSWHVNYAVSAFLEWEGHNEEVGICGKRNIKARKSTVVYLKAVGKDGKRIFSKYIKIGVFDESNVQFSSDKQFTLPKVPITLSWIVHHAKKVELEGFGEVKAAGTKTVEVETDTTFILSVIDAFGQQRYELPVRMLPLPIVKMVNIPTPDFVQTVNVSVVQQKIEIKSHIPKIDVMGIQFSTPVIPSLSELGLNVKNMFETKSKLGIWSELKSLFNHYNRRKNGKE